MDEKKRAPTEMEVQLLLRNVARKAEDEATVSDYAAASAGVLGLRRMTLIAGGSVLTLFLLEGSMRSLPGMVALLALSLALVQGVEIGRLARVTKALARTAERARAEAPLPRAPSPPAARP